MRCGLAGLVGAGRARLRLRLRLRSGSADSRAVLRCALSIRIQRKVARIPWPVAAMRQSRIGVLARHRDGSGHSLSNFLYTLLWVLPLFVSYPVAYRWNPHIHARILHNIAHGLQYWDATTFRTYSSLNIQHDIFHVVRVMLTK